MSLTNRRRFAGMYFHARFHRNKSFKELSRITRGYKTSSPKDGPSKKSGRMSCAKKHQTSFHKRTLPEPEQSQQSHACSERDTLWDSTTRSIPPQVTTHRQPERPHGENHIPILATPSKEKERGSCCLTSFYREITSATVGQKDFTTCKFSTNSHPSGEAPHSNSKCISPWTAFRFTPPQLLLSSQISRSDSWDWDCSPPVGQTTRGDILGSCTPTLGIVEKSTSASLNPRDFHDYTDTSRRSVYDDAKDIPVQVYFHGSGADISPLLPKFHRSSSRP